MSQKKNCLKPREVDLHNSFKSPFKMHRKVFQTGKHKEQILWYVTNQIVSLFPLKKFSISFCTPLAWVSPTFFFLSSHCPLREPWALDWYLKVLVLGWNPFHDMTFYRDSVAVEDVVTNLYLLSAPLYTSCTLNTKVGLASFSFRSVMNKKKLQGSFNIKSTDCKFYLLLSDQYMPVSMSCYIIYTYYIHVVLYHC